MKLKNKINNWSIINSKKKICIALFQLTIQFKGVLSDFAMRFSFNETYRCVTSL